VRQSLLETEPAVIFVPAQVQDGDLSLVPVALVGPRLQQHEVFVGRTPRHTLMVQAQSRASKKIDDPNHSTSPESFH
jgi:hypothetical protein